MAIIKTDLLYNDTIIGGYISNGSLDRIFEVNYGPIEEEIKTILDHKSFSFESVTLSYNHESSAAEMKISVKANEETKDFLFILPGIPEDVLQEEYDLSYNEKDFDNDPFPLSFSSPAEALGTMEAAIDILAHINNMDSPSGSLKKKMGGIRRKKTSAYLVRLFNLAGLIRYERTSKNMEFISYIEKLTEFTEDITELSYEDAARAELSYSIARMRFTKKTNYTTLKYFRKKFNKSQSDIAKELGISLRQYQRYESLDSTLPAAGKLIVEKLAKIFNIQETDLVKDGTIVVKEL